MVQVLVSELMSPEVTVKRNTFLPFFDSSPKNPLNIHDSANKINHVSQAKLTQRFYDDFHSAFSGSDFLFLKLIKSFLIITGDSDEMLVCLKFIDFLPQVPQ